MPAQLVTPDEALAHLRIEQDENSADLELKLWAAEETVLKFIERNIDTGWTSDSVPLQVKAAILLVLTHLWEHRGEEDTGEALSPNVRGILRMFRDPIVA